MLRAKEIFPRTIFGTRAIGLAALYETVFATHKAFTALRTTSLRFTLILSPPSTPQPLLY
jgi:hypothetical protein